MRSFTMSLAALAIEEVLAEQALAKWRAEHTFHVPPIVLPIEISVDGVSVFIQQGWTPPPINFAAPPTMAKPPCNSLKLPP